MKDRTDQSSDASLQGQYDEKFRNFVVRVSAVQMLKKADLRDQVAIDEASEEACGARVAYNQASDAFALSLVTTAKAVTRERHLNN